MPVTNSSPSVTDTNRLDTTTASGDHLHEAHVEPTNDLCESDPGSPISKTMTIREGLKTMEEVAVQESEADAVIGKK